MKTTEITVGMESRRKPTAVVFCCGIGLTSLALRLAGYEIIGAIDYWDYAEQIYRLNFPDVKFMRKSLREITSKMICDELGIKPGDVDLIQISNPCTDISRAGDGDPLSATNDLFFAATKLAFELNPKVVVYENVESLTDIDMAALFGMFYSFLQRAAPDYSIQAKVLNAHTFGDPQARKRIFVQTSRVGHPVWAETVPIDQRKVISDVFPEAEYLKSRNYGELMYYPHQPAPTVTGHASMTTYDGIKDTEVSPIKFGELMGITEDHHFILEGSISNQKLGIGNGVCIGVMRALANIIRKELLGNDSPPESDPDPNFIMPFVAKKSSLKLSQVDDIKTEPLSSIKETHIQWTTFTWNPHVGCEKISTGCKNCYLYRNEERLKKEPSVVRRTGKSTFNKPLRIQGPAMVFICSYSDFFIEQADVWRNEIWDIIRKTPHLTYQILTKRPERILQCLPDDWNDGYKNVWLGVSVENQETLHRAETLAQIPSKIRFISAEPLLGPLDLTTVPNQDLMEKIHWIIVGGESGNSSGKYQFRPTEQEWMEQLIRDVKKTGAALFVKQTGNYLARQLGMKDRFGGKYEEFPFWMKHREFP